jgi:hypothetical protein
MQDQGHEVARHVIALSRQKQNAVPRFGTELQFQLHVLICGTKRGESEPTLARETR